MPFVQFNVNGKDYSLECNETESVLDILRNHLGLTGTKHGCDSGLCGACTVVMNGRSVRSCQIQATQLNHATIITIEGLGSPSQLHPLQEAFIDTGAVQCGFCTPGMIMEAYSLLKQDHSPNLETIRHTFRNHLCRCTGYLPIENAIQKAARSKSKESNRTADSSGIGHSLHRLDGIEKVTGSALYTDDIHIPNLCFGALLFSPVASGVVKSISIENAKKSPGVIRVITAQDIPGYNGVGRWHADRPLLVEDQIRFAGDALALVIADTESHARLACKSINVEIDQRDPILTPENALSDTALPIHSCGNIASRMQIDKHPVDLGSEIDLRRISTQCVTQHIEHALLEPLCALAYIDDDQVLNVIAPTQNVYFDRLEIQRILGIPPREFNRVRIHQPSIGGAFGKHEDIFIGPLAAVAAFLTGRPCKIRLSRSESFRCSSKRHPMKINHSSLIDTSGIIQRSEIKIIADTGAYSSWAPNILRKAIVHSTGPYEIPSVCVSGTSVFTNAAFSGAMRGFGAAQSLIAAELHMDQIAYDLGIDPLDFRMNHALARDSLTATSQSISDNNGLRDVLSAAAERFNWKGPLQGVKTTDGLRRGVGIAGAFYGIGYGNGISDKSHVKIRIDQDGLVWLYSSAVEYGQGSSTIFVQIVHETLGCPITACRVVPASTSNTPDAGSTVASRQTYVTGNAYHKVAATIRSRLVHAWNQAQDCSISIEHVSSSGWFESNKNEVSWRCITENGFRALGPIEEHYRYINPTDCLDSATGQGNIYRTYAFSAACAEVLFNAQTGRISISRIVSVHDSGRIVNPILARSQVTGGVVMAAGYALCESFRTLHGIPVSTDFNNYSILKFGDVPVIDVLFIETSCESGPFGAKGLGEPAMLATAPALLNAIFDATGKRFTHLPVMPLKN